MKFDFSEMSFSDFVIGVFVIAAIWYFVSPDDDNATKPNSRTNDTMVTCPICNGSGRYNSSDIFMSQMACTGCGGQGRVQSSQVLNIINLHTPSVPSSSSATHHSGPRTKECTHCHGTGTCQSCNGDGIMHYSAYSYGLDPVVCPNCLSKTGVGKGKCQWCSGTGRRR